MSFIGKVKLALKAPRNLRRLQMKVMRDTVRQEFVAFVQECQIHLAEQDVRDAIDNDVRELARIMVDRQATLIEGEKARSGGDV